MTRKEWVHVIGIVVLILFYASSVGFAYYKGQVLILNSMQPVHAFTSMGASDATGAMPLGPQSKIKFVAVAPQTETWALGVTYVSSAPFTVNGEKATKIVGKSETVYQLGTVWDKTTTREYDHIDLAYAPVKAFYSSGGGETLELFIFIE